MTKFTALCAILAITAATPVLANDPAKIEVMMKKHFEMVDANKDGKISQEESEDFADRKFKESDANRDGYITQEEAKVQHEKEWNKMKDKKMSMDSKKAANANPSEHSANSTNPAQKAD